MLDRSRISWLVLWCLILLKLISMILDKAGFNSKISFFFQNYLVDKKMKYLWNNFSFSLFNVDFRVRQSSVLSPILSTLYLSSIFHIILISVISFINDGIFVSEDKSFNVSNPHLFYGYHIISLLLKQFGLVIEHGKIEVFHFSRL